MEDDNWVQSMKAWERQNVMIPLQTNWTWTWFKALMHGLGEACTGDGLVVIFAFLNWCISNQWGTEAIWLVPLAEISNGLFKWYFKSPRPAWIDKSVVQMCKSHEYSFPSSHSMITFSLAVYFSHHLNNYAPYVVAGMVAFSRVYEGMHYPHDVTVGSFLGIALGKGLMETLDYMQETNFHATVSFHEKLALGFTLTAVSTALVVGAYQSLSNTKVLSSWKENVKKSLGEKELDPHRVPFLSYIGMSGVLGGLTLGETLFYLSEPFEMPRNPVVGLARFVVGATVLVSCYFGVKAVGKAVEPHSIVAALVLHFLRFFQVPLIILQVAPPLFQALGL